MTSQKYQKMPNLYKFGSAKFWTFDSSLSYFLY